MFPVHRRTKSRPEIVSYHLFNFHILVLQLNIFDCVILECFDSVPLRPRTVIFEITVRLRLADGSLG